MLAAGSPNSASPPSRIGYLESIRGLASLQVLFLHTFQAQAPALGIFSPDRNTLADFIHASPLFLLYDGYSAVFIFFVLSGYVLTGAFQRQTDKPLRAILARIVRLGLPALFAGFVAAALFVFFGAYGPAAGAAAGSTFLAQEWHPIPGLGALLRDVTFNALFIGYQGVDPTGNLFASIEQPASQAYVGPLWTLSFEFYGSMMILIFCLLRAWRPMVATIVATLCLAFFIRGAYAAFVIGYFLATHRFAEGAPKISRPLALALIGVGAWLCLSVESTWLPPLYYACHYDTKLLFPCTSTVNLHKICGAIFIFCGAIQLAGVRRLLSLPALTAIGRLSFPLYLMHEPVNFGLGAFFSLALAPYLGGATAFATIAAVWAISLTLAWLFQPIDRTATQLSRAITRTEPCQASAFAPAQ